MQDFLTGTVGPTWSRAQWDVGCIVLGLAGALRLALCVVVTLGWGQSRGFLPSPSVVAVDFVGGMNNAEFRPIASGIVVVWRPSQLDNYYGLV